MKKTAFNLLGFLIIIGLMAFTGNRFHTDTFKVDTTKSTLEWYAEKATGKHNGIIKFSNGEIKNDHGNLSGFFEIDMSTIENKDIESAGSKSKLEGHLKSADFFDVEKYPKSKFTITSVTPLSSKESGLTHAVKGMLTIKDKTNEISFDATIKIQGASVTCTGSAIIDRAKFDVKYGSKTFFPDIGDKRINDEFTLKFNVVATK